MKRFDSVWKKCISGNSPMVQSYNSVFQEIDEDVLQGITVELQKLPADVLEKAST